MFISSDIEITFKELNLAHEIGKTQKVLTECDMEERC